MLLVVCGYAYYPETDDGLVMGNGMSLVSSNLRTFAELVENRTGPNGPEWNGTVHLQASRQSVANGLGNGMKKKPLKITKNT